MIYMVNLRDDLIDAEVTYYFSSFPTKEGVLKAILQDEPKDFKDPFYDRVIKAIEICDWPINQCQIVNGIPVWLDIKNYYGQSADVLITISKERLQK